MFENILVVCIGNICRSPMAEAFFKYTLRHSKNNYNIRSAGLGAMIGYTPDQTAYELMLTKGMDISDYHATQINQALIIEADLILVMDSVQKELIEHQHPSARGKVFRLGEWGDFEIADPYQKEREVFEKIMQLIETGVTEWVNKIEPTQ